MTGTVHLTSTGHGLSDGSWLDAHFTSARAEYEASLRDVGIQLGWTVLDAGCGNGGFIPLLSELVGSEGAIVALDFAPEHVAHIEALAKDGLYSTAVRSQVGSVLKLPFDDSSFDCVWSANVIQLLTEVEFDQAAAEFRRVLKPGGILAIKEFDSALMNLQPLETDYIGRIWAAKRAKAAQINRLGAWSGTSVSSRLRRVGLEQIRRKGWLVERWGPVQPETRAFVDRHLARILDDPDFCFREFFVLTVAHSTK
jgi:arsenite methyltransferase